MSISVGPGDPRAPAARALLEASHALMEELFPPEENHYLSIDALCAPGVSFFVAQRGGATLGCAALARREGYGELKSMFVDPAARGTGTAAALLAYVETAARDAGLSHLRLETGDRLHAALAFYARAGFARCGPFGDYRANATSVFMEKPLS